MSTWTMWHHQPARYARPRTGSAAARTGSVGDLDALDGLDGRDDRLAGWRAGVRLTMRVVLTLIVLAGIGVGIGLGAGWALSSAVHLLLGSS